MLEIGLIFFGFVFGFIFKDIFEKIKNKIDKFIKNKKTEEISDDLFVSYIKTFRTFNIDVLNNIKKSKLLKNKEFEIKQGNNLYRILDSYCINDDFIFLYRAAFSLTSKESLSIDNFSNNIFKIKEFNITNEQLNKLDINVEISKMYFKDYSCFPPSFLEEYYFEEKIFVIPTILFLEKEKKEIKKEFLIETKDLIQEFLKDIDDVEIEILSGELIENINIILNKLAHDELNESTYNFFANLLMNIKASYTLLWDNFKNKRDIIEPLEDIELNLNVLNDSLEE